MNVLIVNGFTDSYRDKKLFDEFVSNIKKVTLNFLKN
jgi:hypothetical protein